MKCKIRPPTSSEGVCHWVQHPQAVHGICEKRVALVVFVWVSREGVVLNKSNRL